MPALSFAPIFPIGLTIIFVLIIIVAAIGTTITSFILHFLPFCIITILSVSVPHAFVLVIIISITSISITIVFTVTLFIFKTIAIFFPIVRLLILVIPVTIIAVSY